VKQRTISALRALDRRYVRLVWPLSLAQLVSWGAIYYSFTLFLEPMEADLGLARTELTGALTLGLLISGIGSLPVGALIDKGRARVLMTVASLIGSVLLLAWSQVETVAQLYGIWAGLGVVLAATLYEPAFAVLVRALGDLAPRAIAAMTLIAGFASTAFIPLTHVLIQGFGWRGALLGLAAANLIAALIHFLCLRGQARHIESVEHETSSRTGALGSAVKRPAFWWLTLAFTAGWFTVSAVTFHVVPMLAERGYALALAVSAVALIGPSQVAGRILVTLAAPSMELLAAGCIALGLPALGLILVLAGPESFWIIALFAICFGIGNGISTIVRANAVAEIFGRAGFGAVNGVMNAPVSAARALAPSAASAIWVASGGYGPVLWALSLVCVLGVLAFVIGVILGRKQAARA
jgi:predicted MFS family arabinose efflux permease